VQDKVVIVTGGAAGIGKATARRFSEAGARVAVWDVRSPEAVEEISSTFQRVDVTDPAAVEGATGEVVARWGRIDVLVNNAGITRDAQLVKWKEGQKTGEMSERDFDAVISVNLKGVFLCSRAVAPRMIAGGGGVILNASSVVGLYGNFGQTNYAATKAGVISMTRTWARELGRYNIRVNAVAPGFIATEMSLAMPEKVLQGMIAHTPLNRMGRPEDIAEAYFWLASDAAGFITGTVLSVDGGLVIGT
jgi:3-oxoacyl-[acyl-carrier protein] reductase